MPSLYQRDLAYIQAKGFGDFARAAAPEIIRRLRSSTLDVRRVIDVGCGAGPLAKALVDAGFEVTGVDTSEELLEFARLNVPNADFIRASAYDVQIPACDAVIALGEPLTYHADCSRADELVGDFFRKVADALPSNGMLIFDVIGLGEPSLTARTWASGDDWAVLVDTTENQEERTLVRNIEIFRYECEFYRRSNEVHRVRLFDVQKLRDQLISIGFAVEIADSYGAYPLLPRRHAFFATFGPQR